MIAAVSNALFLTQAEEAQSITSVNEELQAQELSFRHNKKIHRFARQPINAVQTSPSSPCQQFHSLCSKGHLHLAVDRLFQFSTPLPENAYICLLKACIRQKSLRHVRLTCSHIARHHVELKGLLADYLVVALARCGGLEDAHRIFFSLSQRTIFSWTAMISGYADAALGKEALELHASMVKDNIQPDGFTFTTLFRACAVTKSRDNALELHSNAIMRGTIVDAVIGSALVSMYSSCGSILEAECVFQILSVRNIVSWTALLSAYVEQAHGKRAILLYRQMLEKRVSPQRQTIVIMLQACILLAEDSFYMSKHPKVPLEIAYGLHAEAQRISFMSNTFVGSSFMKMYGKCGCMLEATNVFLQLSECDVVSWSEMVCLCTGNGKVILALQLYRQMQEEGVSPNQQTFMNAVQACTMLAGVEPTDVDEQSFKTMALEIGRALHIDASREGFTNDILVSCALVVLYGKCGSISEAEELFDMLPKSSILSWNAMISAYVGDGYACKALGLYLALQNESLSLDNATFVHVLRACAQIGTLHFCRQVHATIMFSGGDICPFVASSLIRTYGCCANMAEAHAIFGGISEPDNVAWNASIAGYAEEGNVLMSLHLFHRMLSAGVKPSKSTFVSILVVLTHVGLVDNGIVCFESMSKFYQIIPELKHYSILIDLLGRAGNFIVVEQVLRRMPKQANLPLWMSLMSACRNHANTILAAHAFENAIQLEPQEAASFILMSNMQSDFLYI